MFGKKSNRHHEHHRSARIGWLRAGVLGANDGIVSTASLITGIAAAQSSRETLLLSGLAGLVAGAMSMAAGEYVSVSSQSDLEQADLAQEKHEIENNTEYERAELAQIYVDRGLNPELAKTVAHQLMVHDALGSHARDELGITEATAARPLQAALASAVTFSIGAALPLAVAMIAPYSSLLYSVPTASLMFLILLGMVSAKAGGASLLKGACRVFFWGALAMGLTAAVGFVFGTSTL